MATSKSFPHPLAQLSEAEFLQARDIIVKLHGSAESIFFRAIHLHEPDRADLVPFLAIEHAGSLTSDTKRPPRLALVEHDVISTDHHEYTRAVVDLGTGEIVSKDAVGRTSQPYFTP